MTIGFGAVQAAPNVGADRAARPCDGLLTNLGDAWPRMTARASRLGALPPGGVLAGAAPTARRRPGDEPAAPRTIAAAVLESGEAARGVEKRLPCVPIGHPASWYHPVTVERDSPDRLANSNEPLPLVPHSPPPSRLRAAEPTSR